MRTLEFHSEEEWYFEPMRRIQTTSIVQGPGTACDLQPGGEIRGHYESLDVMTDGSEVPSIFRIDFEHSLLDLHSVL